MAFIRMENLDLKDKRLLIREDLNVPLQSGSFSAESFNGHNDAKLRAALPTLKLAMKTGAKTLVLTHLGRPKEGQWSSEFSVEQLVSPLSDLLNHPVRFEKDWLNGVNIESGEIVLCENVRFNVGETSNDETLSKRMASLCDIFVMDAFASAHRAHASTVGVAEYAKVSCAGPLLVKEIEALDSIIQAPKRPLLAIVGGAKVSTKLEVLTSLINQVDQLIVGGGIANTFFAALGCSVGSSLYEAELVSKTLELISYAKKKGVEIILPSDVVVGNEISNKSKSRIVSMCINNINNSLDNTFTIDSGNRSNVSVKSEINGNEMILDIGPETSQAYHQIIMNAKTILWNGPVGVFEIDQFAAGTKSLSLSIAASSAFSVAGGGETLAAIDKFGVTDKISYISTGGGAFLEYIEGKSLPAILMLEKKGLNKIYYN